MKVVKTEALGNDFLLMEAMEIPAHRDRRALARSLCNRRRGLGADGLILFEKAEQTPYRMKLYNSDGSDAEISGNGLRCLGAYLSFSGRIEQKHYEIETDAGSRRLELVHRDGSVLVFKADMGEPRLGSRDIPFEVDPPADRVIGAPLSVEGREFHVTALSMGNPQCIVFTDQLDFDSLKYGPQIENHPRFPRKTNVEFVRVENRSRISIGIWERGAGETEASGTGSAASMVAAHLNGKVGEKVTVRCPGGELEVEWRDGKAVFVTGEAVVVAEGDYFREDY